MVDPNDQHEYFVVSGRAGTTGPPDELWRRSGDQWQYLSVVDWSWHAAVPGQAPTVPTPEVRRPVAPAEAAELVADRQRWVRYWAQYLPPPHDPDERPVTVVRRRASPELVLDESFTVDNRWERTPVVVDAEHLGLVSNPPHLEEIDRDGAEWVLREVRGVDGATGL